MNIYILSEPIQAGKTTHIKEWIQTKKNTKQAGHKSGEVWGILAPDDEDGLRHFVALSPLSSRDIAVEVAADEGLRRVQEGDLFTVGKKCFYFKHSAFNWAIEHLKGSLKEATCNTDINKEFWLVLDEVGPLEVKQGKGFDQFMKLVVQEFKKQTTTQNTTDSTTTNEINFVVVVREGLVEDFLKHYDLETYMKHHNLDTNTKQKNTQLVSVIHLTDLQHM